MEAREQTNNVLPMCRRIWNKYHNKADANFLLKYLEKNYTATVDWSGKFSVVSNFIGNITMDMLTFQCQVMSKI